MSLCPGQTGKVVLGQVPQEVPAGNPAAAVQTLKSLPWFVQKTYSGQIQRYLREQVWEPGKK